MPPGFLTTSPMLEAACPQAAAARIRRVRAPGLQQEPLPRAIAGIAFTPAFAGPAAGVRAGRHSNTLQVSQDPRDGDVVNDKPPHGGHRLCGANS